MRGAMLGCGRKARSNPTSNDIASPLPMRNTGDHHASRCPSPRPLPVRTGRGEKRERVTSPRAAQGEGEVRAARLHLSPSGAWPGRGEVEPMHCIGEGEGQPLAPTLPKPSASHPLASGLKRCRRWTERANKRSCGVGRNSEAYCAGCTHRPDLHLAQLSSRVGLGRPTRRRRASASGSTGEARRPPPGCRWRGWPRAHSDAPPRR